ncbi:hypothetical protein BKA56DRAFT_604451 [Ilyonectria sp. MPI-CAGE-AT-0026]|nr:hypothetical protein BKA56DRAFT_604451 [Ilyonectria sp. MPI-CAGE-AT-0026]
MLNALVSITLGRVVQCHLSTSRPDPLQVRCWRLDGSNDIQGKTTTDMALPSSCPYVSTSTNRPERAGVLQGPPPAAPVHAQKSRTPHVYHLPPLNRPPPPSYPVRCLPRLRLQQAHSQYLSNKPLHTPRLSLPLPPSSPQGTCGLGLTVR